MRRLDGQRAEFEHRADVLREKLLHTLDALEQRRHALLDVRTRVRRHAGEATALGVTAALMVGGVAVVAVARARDREGRIRRARVLALVRFWRHPDRVARGSGRPPVLREIGRRVLVGTVTFLAMWLVRRSVRWTLALPGDSERDRRRLPAVRSLPA